MIFGVDLGTRRVAIVQPESGWFYRDDLERAAGKRDYPTEVDAGRALGARVRSAILAGVSGGRFSILGHHYVYERPVTLRGPKANVRTAVGQSLSAGALLCQLPGSNQECSASQWKEELLGDGAAKPADYVAWFQEHHPALAAAYEQDENLVAAHCIGVWAALVASRGELPGA